MPEQQGGNDDKDLGLDWLAAQLNADGEADGEAAAEPDEEAAGDTAADTDADARPDSAPTVALPVAPVVVPPVAPPADAPAAPPAPVAERAVPERPAAQVPSPDSAPAGGDTAPVTAPAEPASGGFRWGLTPSIEPDPAVGAARRTPPTPAAPEAPVPAAAPPVAAASAPPAAAAPPVTPATPAAAPPVTAASAPQPAAAPPVAAVPAADPEPTQPLTKTPAPPRRSPADLEAAPWWTTPAQSRLVPTAEEETAALGRRTPAAPPSPLDTGVAPRTTADSATAPVSRHAARGAAPLPEPAPAGVPVSAATAAAATGAATAAPGHDAHAAPAPSADEPGPRRRGPGDGGPPRRPTKRDLRWVGGAVIAVLVIIGLFFLGQSLGDTPVAAPTESASAEPDATTPPTTAPEPAATGPQPAGVHAWNTLFGTECLEPYSSPWEEEFTVVDCATPHTGQLVYRGILEGDSGSPFPGEQAFADQINVLCSAPGVIDFEAAGAYADVQLQGSYPVTAEQWDAGERYFYCFASRSSGEPLTASLSPAA